MSTLAKFSPDLNNFLNSCPYYKQFGRVPRPDYVGITLSIDLEGDKIIMLPDQNKRHFTEKHNSQKETSKII